MTDKKAMKLALEALTYIYTETTADEDELIDQAITAIKEALAQPEITTGNILMDSYNAMQSMKVEGPRHVVCQCDKCKAQPEQEPVGQLLEDAFGRGQVMWFNKPKDESMLYTTPPQRTWVGLTEQEHTDIAVECGCMNADWVFYGAAVERKVKERNT